MLGSTHNENLREEFNRWAETGRGEEMEEGHLPITLPVLDLMQLAPDDNVLDVGSDEMVRRARRNYVDLENTMFVSGAAEEIPWDANFFTRVISVESAYYWPDPARGLAEIFRVLREGGSAWVLINYYGENPHSHQWSERFAVPIHLLGAEEWASMFRDAGFAAVAHRRIPDPTPAPESYSGRWFRDAAQLRAFREIGALLIHGTKPRMHTD